jgi:hemerythrin superfamily protein
LVIQKEELAEHELIVDSSEQARERPLDYQEQKKYDSGKKKHHTLKTQLIILPQGENNDLNLSQFFDELLGLDS